MTGWGAGGVFAAMLLAACQADGRDPRRATGADHPAGRPAVTDVAAQDYPAPPLPRAKVVVHDAFGGRHVVEVEVAAAEWARTRGMMWRTELEDGHGMLFIFRGEDVRSFWMRNTLIPLDMLFIDERGTIAGIVESAQPRTLTSRGVGKPSQYVLEVPGGWAGRKGIGAGGQVEFHGIAGIPVE